MDAESLAQIEQIVSGAEGRLRKEMTTLGTSLRQEFGEKLNEKFEAAKRHRGVLLEELCRKLDLMIESQQGLHEDMDHLATSINREFRKTQALIRSMIHQSNPQSITQPPQQSYLA